MSTEARVRKSGSLSRIVISQAYRIPELIANFRISCHW